MTCPRSAQAAPKAACRASFRSASSAVCSRHARASPCSRTTYSVVLIVASLDREDAPVAPFDSMTRGTPPDRHVRSFPSRPMNARTRSMRGVPDRYHRRPVVTSVQGGRVRLLGRPLRWRSSLSAGTVAVVTTALVALALVHDGLPTTDVALNDSGVWVTRTQDNLVGRFNHEATAMDGAVSTGTADADVMQQGDAVLVQDRGAHTVAVVDVAGVLLSGSSQVPKNAVVGLGAHTVAVLDRSSGKLWVVPVDGAGSFSADATEPVAELRPDGALAVGTDGTVHAASGRTLVTVTTGSRGAPDEVRR